MGGTAPRRVAGCDIGKATAKFAIVDLAPGQAPAVESDELVVHEGRPMEVFREWYRRRAVHDCAALGATGLHGEQLIAPVVHSLPEDACLEAALPLLPDGPLNLVRIGARGYSVLVRGTDGRVRHLENDKCSSGTGETMVKIAGRFGISIEEADRIARAAEQAIPITARCSVFAKSEMTHFGNQGRPADALFRGYFGSVAIYVAALLARARVEGPVYAVGGGARIGALVDALAAAVEADVTVPAWAQHLEAVGAAALAAETEADPLPADPAALIRAKQRRFRVLEPASRWKQRVTRMPEPPRAADAASAPVVLGLDLGSTGSKAVLTSVETGEAVLDLYDRTRGNPVEAARGLIRALLERAAPDVRAIGITGSGREAVATVVRAAFPGLEDRIIVVNEIVAHATAAIRCDDRGGEDLTVVEIGGQDAKFIRIAGGQIVESDMNKACSAGTGSFLEEQAVFYGVEDIEEFTARATEAERPPDLGQMCTVFVAEAAGEARAEGFSVDDLFGGFQYSVIYNYLNRVMGQRTFGQRIFFQGKPATGPSLAWTLAAVTGREVVVPPNPGAMGAWGIGLVAIEQLGDALADATGFDLNEVTGVAVEGRTEFQCRDKRCATLCNIEKTTVRVGEAKRTVVSGGACPKFEVSTAARPKLAIDAPSAFDERRALVAEYATTRPGGRVVGVPVVGALHGYVPWLATLLTELGFEVKLLEADAASLARGEERCYSFDACAPVKVAHGVVDGDVYAVFFPKLLGLGDRDGADGLTCPMEQALPEMIRESLYARGRQARIEHPVLDLQRGLRDPDLLRRLVPALLRLGAPMTKLWRAVRRASAAQHRYERELAAIGQRTLRYGRRHGIPVVALCGNLHVIHDPVVGAGIPRLLRENGVLALPMDCYPIPVDTPPATRVAWAETRRAIRVGLAARARGDAFPLLLTSFGCGPSSFVEQVFADLMGGYPHAVFESDGHGGTAGYVTRVQAFLHAVRQYAGGASPAPAHRVRRLEPLGSPPLNDERDARFVALAMTDRLAPIVAAGLRSYGFDAVASDPPSADVLSMGRRDCSGKECLPYQLVWGAHRKHLEDHPPDKRTLLMQVAGSGMCRNCMFSIKDQINIERLGMQDKVSVRHFEPEPSLGPSHFSRVWVATVAWDVINQLTAYFRPMEREPGAADALYHRYCDEIERIVERPGVPGLRGMRDFTRDRDATRAVIGRAAAEFAAIDDPARQNGHTRTVLLSGDIYVRLDEFAGDNLVRRLNERGLRVIVEPMNTLAEYAAHERLPDLFGLPTDRIPNAIARYQLAGIRNTLYGEVRKLHRWLPNVEVRDVIAASRALIDRHPTGECPVTVGSVLHHWHQGICDGVVIASPWGCGPSLVSESILRHRSEIPMLFVYCDGSPLDERRLDAFAFRLRRSASRVPAAEARA